MSHSADVVQVRRFNRRVTQRVGALNDHFLGRDRSLGEARVLWEIGPNGCEVRALRMRLGLDSGYLSRLLRALEDSGLVHVAPSPDDGRVRTVSLTKKGVAERAVLDERSDELATSILDSLSKADRKRLVIAMREVEEILTTAVVEIREVDPTDSGVRHCIGEYFKELDRRFAAGFDPHLSIAADDEELRPPNGVVLLAAMHSEPVGCGALKFHGHRPTEIKRMWVSPAARGFGVGRRLLGALEDRAARERSRTLHLETNASLTEAISMYRAAGYKEVAAFNDEQYADHWFEKKLPRTRK